MDVPDVQLERVERGRVTAAGGRVDTGGACELVVSARADGRWAVQGPDSPVVVLDATVVVYVARWILGQAETGSIRWVLSPSGRVSHAVNEVRCHPGGTVAECGRRLTGVVSLLDRPSGAVCPQCAELQVARALPVSSHPAPDG